MSKKKAFPFYEMSRSISLQSLQTSVSKPQSGAPKLAKCWFQRKRPPASLKWAVPSISKPLSLNLNLDLQNWLGLDSKEKGSPLLWNEPFHQTPSLCLHLEALSHTTWIHSFRTPKINPHREFAWPLSKTNELLNTLFRKWDRGLTFALPKTIEITMYRTK